MGEELGVTGNDTPLTSKTDKLPHFLRQFSLLNDSESNCQVLPQSHYSELQLKQYRDKIGMVISFFEDWLMQTEDVK